MISDDDIIRAADLAERLVEEVSVIEQDWALVERLAGELAVLARRLDRAELPPPG